MNTLTIPGILLFASAAFCQSSKPFPGSLAAYTHYRVDEQVSSGGWTFHLIRPSVLFPIVHSRNGEFKPKIGEGRRMGDYSTTVLAIELVVRNDSREQKPFPPVTIISDIGTGRLFEYEQFSDAFIRRHLDPTVLLDPDEQLVGVICFECCIAKGVLFPSGSHTYLKLPGQASLT